MGLFKDSFGIGAGATLGNLSVQTGCAAATSYMNAAGDRMYTKFRSEKFDPIIRQDLCDIIVRGALAEINYPFPLKASDRRANFFVRHKVFWIITVIVMLLYFQFFHKDLSHSIDDSKMNAFVLIVFLYIIYVMGYVVFALVRKVLRGTQNLMVASSKAALIEEGKRYWNIREYVRQALQIGELSIENAIVKISNTGLGCQFPDTVDQIEANAFYYRQRLGL